MDAGEILSVDLQECGGDIYSHEQVIERWLEMDGKSLSDIEKMQAMSDARLAP